MYLLFLTPILTGKSKRQTVAAWLVTSTHFGFTSNFAEFDIFYKDSVRTFHGILSIAPPKSFRYYMQYTQLSLRAHSSGNCWES